MLIEEWDTDDNGVNVYFSDSVGHLPWDVVYDKIGEVNQEEPVRVEDDGSIKTRHMRLSPEEHFWSLTDKEVREFLEEYYKDKDKEC